MPIVSVAIDPYSIKTWPTLWEIIHSGECCKYSRALAIALNVYYIDKLVDIRVSRIYDKKSNDEYMIVVINECMILNTPYDRVVDLQSVINKFDIKESWSIQDILYAQEI